MPTARPSSPRIGPLAPEAMDAQQSELMAQVGLGGPTVNIFATLVRHPGLFRRWMPFGGKLLSGRLPARDRELLVLRTGWRCRSEYEWAQHVVVGRASGLSDDEIARVTAGPDADGWDDHERVLLRAADELHDDACVSDATWADLAARYDERQLIEVPMVVGHYHLVSFTLNSLGVPLEDGVEGFPGGGVDRDRSPAPARTVLVVGAGTRPSPEPDPPPRQRAGHLGGAAPRRGPRVDVRGPRPVEAAEATAALVERGGGRGRGGRGRRHRPRRLRPHGRRRDPGSHGVVVNAGIGRGAGGLSPHRRRGLGRHPGREPARSVPGGPGRGGGHGRGSPTGGSLVFIGSLAGRPARQPASRPTTHRRPACIGLSRHVALEGARRGVRANVVVPGLIDTPLGRAATRGRPSRGRTRVPLGRQGTAHEVAAAVLFLLSDDASYVTGTTLTVDGGLGLI